MNTKREIVENAGAEEVNGISSTKVIKYTFCVIYSTSKDRFKN